MLFEPGHDRLECQSCGHREMITELVSKLHVVEESFAAASTHESNDWGMETQVIRCSQCAGEIIDNKLSISTRCPFCGSTSVQPVGPGEDILAPDGVIPFKISEKRATMIFKTWLKDRFLAPEKLAQNSKLGEFRGRHSRVRQSCSSDRVNYAI